MISPKLTNILEIISENLTRRNIPFAVIGAMALAAYGLPRYTADADFLTESRYQPKLLLLMEKLGYTCRQKTDTFAQFDSEMGVLGYADFMFISSESGKDMLRRRVVIRDAMARASYPVIQPSDYIILKLMAVANNPDRSLKDEADILELLKLYSKNLISEIFEPLNTERIRDFADRFRQTERIERCLNTAFRKSHNTGCHTL
ncbi:hypothetical protein [Desulfonema magnum]|uniref:Nucleotidyltransferase family protein n=1 Tax=Desulfonema magnum TaxID=45655 RepID=A0A975GMT2_9BACT|nr:hypothetical protein [Desulfonema magnum]QTA87044.1 Uncharacterized protein dnm_030710 [Desulfonema magnum]